ncbi:uncharacterized protein LOC8283100 [Ricinus communis]|uniref:Serine-rich protein n=1 Tax=Ricinus communis TaxID=3988 RepID=B9SWU0_RICCO|nr:uncharacterized protein LOC8283100 [Ricinus communis]EEF31929.1 conserved hypothetical protein [Ricinus communis]|eukprot:XP_002530459.3 uncharacterized protein LOC8283100 [Ricinus communis]
MSMAIKNHPSSSSSPYSRRRTCLCSPSAHPGSFKCSFHRIDKNPRSRRHCPTAAAHLNPSSSSSSFSSSETGKAAATLTSTAAAVSSKSKMVNNLMMTLNINLLKAFLLQIIKPPRSPNLQRRRTFQPNKPTRFCPLNNGGRGHHHGVTVS